jgi:hypothetical protein
MFRKVVFALPLLLICYSATGRADQGTPSERILPPGYGEVVQGRGAGRRPHAQLPQDQSSKAQRNMSHAARNPRSITLAATLRLQSVSASVWVVARR